MKRSLLTTLLIGAAITTLCYAQSARTKFDPRIHGFMFKNDFKNDNVPFVNFHTGGLCGGMVYASLDYFLTGRKIPRLDYRPAVGSPLHTYIFNREATSLASNLDRWTDVSLTNPNGGKNKELFERGLRNDLRLGEVKRGIDAGSPVQLGLAPMNGAGLGHQVLAIGYDYGRYQGALGDYREDLQIVCYDPNSPGQMSYLRPDVAHQCYTMSAGKDAPNERYLTYFVDDRYRNAAPPAIIEPADASDGLIHYLLIQVWTGSDDLRGMGDDCQVAIKIEGQGETLYNLNNGSHWIADYDMCVPIELKTPIRASQLRSVEFKTNFKRGIHPEAWNVTRIVISGRGSGIQWLYDQNGTPLVYFTTDHASYVAEIHHS